MKLPDIVDPEGEVTATVTDPELRLQQAEPVANHAPDPGLAQRFLERVVPWPGPQGSGWINLHCHSKNHDPAKNGGKDWVVGWPFKTVDDFIGKAKWLETTHNFYDAWFCTSQQNQIGENRSGKAKAVRLHKNVTWLKAIWIDVDVKVQPADWDEKTRARRGSTTRRKRTRGMRSLPSARRSPCRGPAHW